MATLGTDHWWDEIGPLLERPEVRARVLRMDRVVDAVPRLAGLGLMRGLLAAHPLGITNPPPGCQSVTANQRPSGSLNAKLRTPPCSPISVVVTPRSTS